jgi:DNA polymerase III delta subunit
MIVLIVGKESARVGERALVLDGAPPREMLFGDDVSAENLSALAQGQSLFGEVRTFGIVGAAENEAWLASIVPVLPALQSSAHLFLFEEDAGVSFAKSIEKAKGRVVKVKAEVVAERVDTFALANALGARDKKKLWLLYTEALAAGSPAEMLAGMLAWKARSMLASEQKGRVPTGWKAGESEKLSSALVSLYHNSRRGAGSLDLLLEQFILSL